MINTNNSIATRLHCSAMPIPVEFKDRAMAFASKYVNSFSLSGLYRMDYNIVYNRICNLVNVQLSANPEFSVQSFSHFINANTLFYSSDDIQTLIHAYKTNPESAFPFIICFFARKLNSFKRCKIAYIKGLDAEDVDEVLMIAVYKTLERYDPKYKFSFSYLELELFAAITQLGGEMHTFGLPRNDYVNYLKFSYFVDKYALTPENIECFLSEINLPDEVFANAQLTFPIDEKDHKYSCKITLRKALDYLSLYSIEHLGVVSATYYDEEADMVIDNTGATFDPGFEDALLNLYAEQTFSEKKERRIFHRLTEPEGATFTNRELADEYVYTRYALSKLKKQVKKDFFL